MQYIQVAVLFYYLTVTTMDVIVLVALLVINRRVTLGCCAVSLSFAFFCFVIKVSTQVLLTSDSFLFLILAQTQCLKYPDLRGFRPK